MPGSCNKPNYSMPGRRQRPGCDPFHWSIPRCIWH
ncbi:hypothetical protein Gotur_026497 [Gossypium turneri]